VWLNPPFDRYKVGRWIGRLADHGNGTALLHARTETEWFRICWPRATGILFMAKRLIFVKPDGTPCTAKRGERANSGAPPVLVAFGDYDATRLRTFGGPEAGEGEVTAIEEFEHMKAAQKREARKQAKIFADAFIAAVRTDWPSSGLAFQQADCGAAAPAA
jgi:hypothetical protein